MTLVEFLDPLAGAGTNQAKVLAILYYKERYENIATLTVDQIRKTMSCARIPGAAKINIADILGKAGAAVDRSTAEGKKGFWSLTESGRIRVRELLGVPANDVEIEHDVGTLEQLIASVTDLETKDYLQEALKCLSVGAIRACVVFVWSGVIRTLQNKMITYGFPALNTALLKHDQKVRTVASLDDFAYIKDTLTLLAAKEMGLLDKNEKDTLHEALNLRNRCGHPGNYKPGIKKASSFIEDMISIVFS